MSKEQTVEEMVEFLFSGENEIGTFKHQGIGNCTRENVTNTILQAQETARREAVEYIRNTAKERGEWSKGYEESIETLTNNN